MHIEQGHSEEPLSRLRGFEAYERHDCEVRGWWAKQGVRSEVDPVQHNRTEEQLNETDCKRVAAVQIGTSKRSPMARVDFSEGSSNELQGSRASIRSAAR